MQFILKHHKPTFFAVLFSNTATHVAAQWCSHHLTPKGTVKSGIGMAEAKTEAPTSDANLGHGVISKSVYVRKLKSIFTKAGRVNRSLVFEEKTISIKKTKFVDVPICLVSNDQPLFLRLLESGNMNMIESMNVRE